MEFKVTHYVCMATWFFTSIVALSVGMSALGFDVEALLHLENISKLVRYAAGFSGGYSLCMLLIKCCKSCCVK